MGRPVGKIPDWGSGSNYVSPGKAWNGLPRRVEPSDAVVTAGFEPEDRPPAERFNWLLGKYGDSLRYLDQIESLNWNTFTYGTGPIGDMCWSEVQQFHFACKDAANGNIYSGYDGENCTAAEHTPAGASETRSIDVSDIDGRVWAVGRGAATDNWTYTRNPATGVWTAAADPATLNAPRIVRFDPYHTWFWVGSGGAAQIPKLGRYTTSVATAVNIVLANQAGYLGGIELLAFGPTLKLAIMPHATAAKMWSVPFAGPGVEIVGPAFLASNPRALVYSMAHSLFFVTTAAGEVWSSSDGTSWTLRSFHATWAYTRWGLEFNGATLVASLVEAGKHFLAISADEGVTFKRMVSPNSGVIRKSDSRLVTNFNRASMRLLT